MSDLIFHRLHLQHQDLCGPGVRLCACNAQIESTLLYGCQVWGPDFVCTDHFKVFSIFMRFVTGVITSVTAHKFFDKFSQHPVQCAWDFIKFLNALAVYSFMPFGFLEQRHPCFERMLFLSGKLCDHCIYATLWLYLNAACHLSCL